MKGIFFSKKKTKNNLIQTIDFVQDLTVDKFLQKWKRVCFVINAELHFVKFVCKSYIKVVIVTKLLKTQLTKPFQPSKLSKIFITKKMS